MMSGVLLPNLDGWIERLTPRIGLAGTRLLELGCGPGRDAAALAEAGFEVVAFDRSKGQLAVVQASAPEVTLLRADIGCTLPFRNGVFGGAVASLSMHYLPWIDTVRAFREVRRVLQAGAWFAFRVNATDDVNFGAGQGVEVERHFYRVELQQPERYKRFFDEAAARAAVDGAFEIEQLTHGWISRYGLPKRVWECLARAI